MPIALSLAVLTVTAPGTILADVRVDGQVRYTLTKTHETGPAGGTRVRSVYRDLAGHDALVMEAELKRGRPVRVTAKQLQTKVDGVVRIRPGRVAFERKSRAGEVETKDHEVLGVVMVGPGLTQYLQSDGPWRRLLRGDAVRVQIAAWTRMDTYEFEFRRADESPANQVVVLMRPSTWLIRAFVDEMRYTFDARTRRLLSYRGPVGLQRISKDGEAEPLNAEVVYRDPAEVSRR